MYFFLFFADLESFLLVAMAYDRYVAICFPLHYTAIMSPRLCLSLLVLSWVPTTFHAMLHTLLMARLHFCEDNGSPTFSVTCLLCRSCPALTLEWMSWWYLSRRAHSCDPLSTIITSHTRIVSSTLKVLLRGVSARPSPPAVLPLTVVSLFYGTVIGLYFYAHQLIILLLRRLWWLWCTL